jgi:hypothetical protein
VSDGEVLLYKEKVAELEEKNASVRLELGQALSKLERHNETALRALKMMGYKGEKTYHIEALSELVSEGYTLTKEDVDVMDDALRLVREQFKKAGIDLPFLDDCAKAATTHIDELKKTANKLAISEFEAEVDRDHRPYLVRFQQCRICKAKVMVSIKYPHGWSETGDRDKIVHEKTCILRKG